MFNTILSTVSNCTIPAVSTGVKPQLTLMQVIVQFVLAQRHNLQAIEAEVSCERCAKGGLAAPTAFDVTTILRVAAATATPLTPRLLPFRHVRVVLFVLRVATEACLHVDCCQEHFAVKKTEDRRHTNTLCLSLSRLRS